MQQNIKIQELQMQLKVSYWLSLVLILMILGFMEYDEYMHPTKLTANTQIDDVTYLIEVGYDLLSMVGIWFALKMMKMDFAKKRITACVKGYYRLATYREVIMFCIVLGGIILHYLTYCPSTLWCSLIGGIATLFVWPTKSRWESETMMDESDKMTTQKV